VQLTDQGRQKIDELARRYAVSADAVMTMLQAVVNGNGSMAQFSHPELGGSGQWMRGGMTMVGDMFNYGLKSKVDGLCSELSQLLAQRPFVPPPASTQSQSQQDGPSLFVPDAPGMASGQWWPAELGSPNGTGAQNQIRYAYFNPARRLAVDLNGHVTIYDTVDHRIGGVSQQQGGGSSLTFTSQHGTVSVSTLPVVSVDGRPSAAPSPRVVPAPVAPASVAPAPVTPAPAVQSAPPAAESAQEADIFAKIERLADLHRKGILSEQEFSAKKAELLSRL
jgi:hypothetical protein